MAVQRRRFLATVVAAASLLAMGDVYAQSSGAGSVKLAMKGYDPVAYFTQGRPTLGSSAFSHVWDGTRYQFESAAHRDLFAADPAKYAPQYAGSCAISMAGGARREGQPENWAIADGRLFLFAGASGPEVMRGNSALVAQANQNWQKLGP